MSCPSATARHGAFERGYPRRLHPDCPAPGPDHRAGLPYKLVELAGLTSLDATIPAHHSEEQRTGNLSSFRFIRTTALGPCSLALGDCSREQSRRPLRRRRCEGSSWLNLSRSSEAGVSSPPTKVVSQRPGVRQRKVGGCFTSQSLASTLCNFQNHAVGGIGSYILMMLL